MLELALSVAATIYAVVGFPALTILLHYSLVTKKDAALKRQIHAPLGVIFWAYISSFCLLFTPAPFWTPLLLAPFVVLMWVWQSKYMKFCRTCGSTVFGSFGIAPRRCKHCGGKRLL